MKKMISALFAVFTIMMFTSTTAFAAEEDNSICDLWKIQLIDFPSCSYVDDESDDPLLYRVMEQEKEMEKEAKFNPCTFTKELLMNGAKVKVNLDQSASGKHFVDIDVYKETSNTEDCESIFYDACAKSFSADGVEFTVIGNSSINWRVEIPF